MKISKIYIGEIIRSVMNRKGICKAELARLVGIKPQSVDYLLKRKSIDTDMLYNLSLALDYDFSKLYRIDQINHDQINFDTKPSGVKVSIEMTLSEEDIMQLNLKDRIVKILEK